MFPLLSKPDGALAPCETDSVMRETRAGNQHLEGRASPCSSKLEHGLGRSLRGVYTEEQEQEGKNQELWLQGLVITGDKKAG